ncbi:hypothetical protein PRIPAC_71089, partial [Pristionchus pacificus]|uniref:G protein-coupled receptor n=1 Tax=Pristionchus pacificus TaxID=54126 RepID=A0A2A6B510_PRIPA
KQVKLLNLLFLHSVGTNLLVRYADTITGGVNTGLNGPIRETGKHTYLLIVEALFGFIVAISNIVVIIILIAGWKRLMKNHFYIVVANLVVFTSLKAFVEIGFIIPYYVIRNEEGPTSSKYAFGIFPTKYEQAIFNVSILADYGILLIFELVELMAFRSSFLFRVNRYLTVTRSADAKEIQSPRLRTALFCVTAWISSGVIPLLFYLCDCYYTYNDSIKLYYNKCSVDIPWINTLLSCLIYLTYACAIIVFILYLLIFLFLRREKRKLSNRDRPTNKSTVQMKLLRQSAVVFILYACSMASVSILSFINPGETGFATIAYAENLLNLSIAAIYPICFVVMSGDMKSILISKLMPNASGKVS